MTAATFEDHPTDPEKVILRKKPYLDKGADYEHGFIDGMQYQMQSSVDKAVNAMAQPEQEPVAWGMPSAGGGFIVDCITPEEHDRVEGAYTIPLYTTPPQRTWVGLTDEEISELIRATHNTGSFVRAIEAKLKEKNT